MFSLSTTKWHNNIQQLDLQVSRNGQQLQLCCDMQKCDRVFFLGLISVPISTCRGEHLGVSLSSLEQEWPSLLENKQPSPCSLNRGNGSHTKNNLCPLTLQAS